MPRKRKQKPAVEEEEETVSTRELEAKWNSLSLREKSEWYGEMGALKEMKDDIEGARIDFQKALVLDRSNGEIWTALGIVCDRMGDFSHAQAAFSNAMRVAPPDAEWAVTAIGFLAKLRFQEADWVQARDGYKMACEYALRFGPCPEPLHMFNLGVTHKELGEIEEARTVWEECIKQESDSRLGKRAIAGCHHQLGILLFDSKDFEGALVHHEKATRLYGDHSFYLWVGKCHEELKNVDKAEAAFLSMTTLNPAERNWTACGWDNVGRIRISKNDLVGGKDALERACELDSTEPVYFNSLGEVLDRLGDSRGSQKAYLFGTRCIDKPEGASKAWVQLGNRNLVKGDWIGARHLYEKGTEVDPKNADAWSKFTQVCRHLGDREATQIGLERTLALNPNDKNVIEIYKPHREMVQVPEKGRIEKEIEFDKMCQANGCDAIEGRSKEVKWRMCERCRDAWYCSRECLSRDWDEKHRFECKPMKRKEKKKGWRGK